MKLFAFVVAAPSILAASAALAAPLVLNPNFTSPAASPGYNYGPVTDWTQVPFPANPSFAGGYLSGVSEFGAFWDNGTVPGQGTGGQVAFIQAYTPNNFNISTDSLEQSVSGFQPGVTYTLSYYENSRAGTSAPDLTVFVGSQAVVATHIVNPVGGSNPFVLVTSSPFTVSSTTELVKFQVDLQGGNGDASAVITGVSITPEPASLGLLGLGSVGLLSRRRRA